MTRPESPKRWASHHEGDLEAGGVASPSTCARVRQRMTPVSSCSSLSSGAALMLQGDGGVGPGASVAGGSWAAVARGDDGDLDHKKSSTWKPVLTGIKRRLQSLTPAASVFDWVVSQLHTTGAGLYSLLVPVETHADGHTDNRGGEAPPHTHTRTRTAPSSSSPTTSTSASTSTSLWRVWSWVRQRSCCHTLAPGDGRSIALLLVLYTLQGVPMGLSASVPYLLTDKVSYGQQAIFSLVSLPFSFKLLWAPIVDSTALRRFGLGRRKSWLLPIQALCGVLMLAASPLVERWMGTDGSGRAPNVHALTTYFFTLYALMATQDIAVDGWALTMLSKGSVGLASTCNTIGQTMGIFVAHVGFLALNSADTCNRFLRSTPSDKGLVTLGGFLQFWGWVFLSTTVLVALKDEEVEPKDSKDPPHQLLPLLAADALESGSGAIEMMMTSTGPMAPSLPRSTDYNTKSVVQTVLATYRQLVQILCLRNVRYLCVLLLTFKAGFAVTESATNLKLAEYGMPPQEIALMSPIIVLLGVAVPVALTRYTTGPRPLDTFSAAYTPRLLVGILYGCLLPHAKRAYKLPGLTPAWFRLCFFALVAMREVVSNSMFVSQMAFFARISDPSIGGTYMTLLNTVSNLGGSWLRTVSLALLDQWTWRECVRSDGTRVAVACTSGPKGMQPCTEAGGRCVTRIDGYHVELAVCTVLGVVWILAARKLINRLQEARPEEWCITPSRTAAGKAS